MIWQTQVGVSEYKDIDYLEGKEQKHGSIS